MNANDLNRKKDMKINVCGVKKICVCKKEERGLRW